MPKKFAVLGNPIVHSQSPAIHQAFAAQFGIKLSYERILVPLDQLAEVLHQFQKNGGQGVNITVPFKIEAFPLIANKTARATKAGAINTIAFNHNACLGDNTDGIGLLRDLTQNHELDLTDQRILILGAGGATKGILQALLSAKPASITIANRTLITAEKLVADFSDLGHCSACNLNQIPDQPFDLIINATSAGVKGELLALAEPIVNNSICYDLAYGSAAQPFLNWAKQGGAINYYDGLGMLVEQAAEAFYIWHQLMPATKPVIKLLRAKL